jgi:predicted DCC family thiol-disulfide oxidoreductase YuxK
VIARDAPRPEEVKPILLFNDECAVCRRLAHWVQKSAEAKSHTPGVVVRAIGDDPDALRAINRGLDIWDAYATIHIVMPDGSMKIGGEAVAEVLRRLPNCRWFSWAFALGLFGLRPFQWALNLGYALLSDARPLLGCDSCGTPTLWVRALRAIFRRTRRRREGGAGAKASAHSTAIRARPSMLAAGGAPSHFS